MEYLTLDNYLKLIYFLIDTYSIINFILIILVIKGKFDKRYLKVGIGFSIFSILCSIAVGSGIYKYLM